MFKPVKVSITNELITKNNISEAQTYSDFGKKQVQVVNEHLRKWLEQQSFASKAPDPQFGGMKIGGYFNEEEYPDRLKWELKFNQKMRESGANERHNKSLGDEILHIKRIPDMTQHNSTPDFFSTLDYIHFDVSNGEKGWISQGQFPVNTHIVNKAEMSDEGIMKKMIELAVFTDTVRDSKAGFSGAEYWAKYRTMAVACSDYIKEIFEKDLKEVEARIKKSNDNGDRFNEKQLMRSRHEHTMALMLNLLPDTRVKNGPTALKSYYEPGVLETMAAWELEKGISSNFGRKSNNPPINYAHGLPIEIISTPGKGAYDANISFELSMYFPRYEPGKSIVLENLQRYFNISESPSGILTVKMPIPNAQRVRANILDGKDNTSLYTDIRDLNDALREVYSETESWEREQLPVLKSAYEAGMEQGQRAHFGRLEGSLKWIKLINK